jgi:hypothetical protein
VTQAGRNLGRAESGSQEARNRAASSRCNHLMTWSLPMFARRGVPVLSLVALALYAGCAGVSRPPGVPIPPSEGARLLPRWSRARSEWPAEYRFDWSFEEQGARMNGRGVARAEPPTTAADPSLGSSEPLPPPRSWEMTSASGSGVGRDPGDHPSSSLLWPRSASSAGDDATLQGAQRPVSP